MAAGRGDSGSARAWLEKVVREIGPDLLYAGPVPSCGFLAARLDVHPLALMSWGYDVLLDMEQSSRKRRQGAFALSRADLFICDCEAVRRKCRPQLGTARIVQLPWGIDPKLFSPALADNLPGRPEQWGDSLVLISNRSWEPVYGIETLAEGFYRAWQQESGLRLVLIGAGSMAGFLQGFIRRHGLQDVIHCPGRIGHDRLPDQYRAADLYVSCSLTDGSSVSLLEAMGCGLPALVTDTGGNPEWIREGVNGWLVPVNDADALARRLLAASFLDREHLRRMGRQGRRLVEQRADWSKNSRRLLAAITELT